MSAGRGDLAVRKQLLLAQSALYRAQLKYEVAALRSRTSRVSTWVGGAITLVSAARAALTIISIFRRR
jgi:hypothetical protein